MKGGFMKHPKLVPDGKVWINRYTGREYIVLPEKPPRGGLYVMVKDITMGEIFESPRAGWHNIFSEKACNP